MKKSFLMCLKEINLVKHEMHVTYSEPLRSKVYPTPHYLEEEIDHEFEVTLHNGIIERSDSVYTAPLVVMKKPGGSNRLSCNYGQLIINITLFDPGPMKKYLIK